MKAKLMALAAAVSAAWAPTAGAQVPDLPILDLSQRGQHISIPGTVKDPKGGGGRQEATFDFALAGFLPGRNGAVCAVGVLTGGGLPGPADVSIPVQTAGRRTNPADCNGRGGGGFGGDDDDDERHGDRDRHGALQRGAGGAALALIAPGGAGLQLIPAQGLPPLPAGACTLVNLVLGPINLNVLGLLVQTNTIRVRVAGDPAGGLLGNLLCSLLGP